MAFLQDARLVGYAINIIVEALIWVGSYDARAPKGVSPEPQENPLAGEPSTYINNFSRLASDTITL
jgi:hypothetical protein